MSTEERLARRLGYTDKVIDHFRNPRNLGVIEDADTSSKVGSVACGDLIKIYLKIDDETRSIRDISFESYGCAANIATSSIMTEMVKGKSIDEARRVTFKEIADALGGLPKIKLHCAVLSRQGLEAALMKYEANKGRIKVDEAFALRILKGVLDPVLGTDIVSAGIVDADQIKVEGAKVVIALKVPEEGQMAKTLREDIADAFEGLKVELDFRFTGS